MSVEEQGGKVMRLKLEKYHGLGMIIWYLIRNTMGWN